MLLPELNEANAFALSKKEEKTRQGLSGKMAEKMAEKMAAPIGGMFTVSLSMYVFFVQSSLFIA